VKIHAALALALFALAFSGCDDKKNPTNPTDLPPKFTATLLTSNEVPAITGPEAGGSGTVTVTFNLTKDAAGTITAATADFAATYSGFPNGTALTLSHIHQGNAGTNGTVVVNLALSAGEVTFPTGSGTLTKNGITMTTDITNQILANPAGFYFNSHTALNPGGVVRGQLVRIQ